jgi:hypothetical protein
MKQIRITFSKGGSIIANMLEEKAPVTCKVIWESLEKPWTEFIMNSNVSGHEIFTPYLPIPEDVKLPNENLRHFGHHGNVATVSPFEYRENTIKGYTPLMLVYGLRRLAPHQDLHSAKMNVDDEEDDNIKQLFKKNMMETCRANIFAQVREEDYETLFEIGRRIRYNGGEEFTIERV